MKPETFIKVKHFVENKTHFKVKKKCDDDSRRDYWKNV